MKKCAVLLISYHFYPSNEVGAKRPSETAIYLQKAGHSVTVLRGTAHGKPDSLQCKKLDGLTLVSVKIPKKIFTDGWIKLKEIVHRLRSAKSVGKNASSRMDSKSGGSETRRFPWLRRQLLAVDTLFQGDKRWLLKSIVKILLLCRRNRYDVIIASGPPMVGYVCGLVAGKLSKAPLILDFRDPWYRHGDKERRLQNPGHPLAVFENRMGQRCISNSSGIIVASPGIRRHLELSFDVADQQIYLVRNGFDDGAIVSEPPPTGRLEILYAGSLYWNRNPFPFLESLNYVASQPGVSREKIQFTLVGNCEEWNGISLQSWVNDKGMRGIVRILPAVDLPELRGLIVSSNLLVNFAQGQPRQIPAKSYEYLAVGRDILIVAENTSDVAALFREAKVGEIVRPDDTESLKDILMRQYVRYVDQCRRSNRKNVNVKLYSRQVQLAEFDKIVQRVALNGNVAKQNTS